MLDVPLKMPAPLLASFDPTVLFTIDIVPPIEAKPPPLTPARLSTKVVPRMLLVPWFQTPPPLSPAELFESVLSARLSVPPFALRMPPPS